MTTAPHTPVLLPDVLQALKPAPGETVVDGTFGAGGYTRGLLETGAKVVAFDRDPSAERFAAGLDKARFRFVGARFSEMAEVLGEGAVDGVALDLGVSSMQLDEADRGFSFMRDGPLDMRMGPEGPTAADLVNTAEPKELARIFFVYGEEHKAAGSPRPSPAGAKSSRSAGRWSWRSSSKRRWAAAAARRHTPRRARSRV